MYHIVLSYIFFLNLNISKLCIISEFSNDRCALKTTADNSEIAVFSRTCYEFNMKGASFEEARKECTKNGGDLVHDFKVNMEFDYFYLQLN